MLVGQVFLPYNLSVGLAPASSPSRGASGEEAKLSGMPRPPLGRSNGDDRRQRRKQGGAVGAAASRMQATAKQTLGAATRAVAMRSIDGEVSPLSCNQTVAFFTLFSKIKGKLKNVLLKKWRICVTLHPSCNGIFGDSGVFFPSVLWLWGRRQSDYHAFFLLFCPFWLFSGHLALWQGGKYGKM